MDDALGPSQREHLISLVREFVRELHPQRSRFIQITPSSRIERDLGIDSLARTELVLRIERALHLHLPAQAVGEAETVEDVIRCVQRGGPAGDVAALKVLTTTALPSVPAPDEAVTLTAVLDWHAARHADRLHLTVLQDETVSLGTLTYGELAARARSVAYGLLERDISPGDRVALMLPTSVDFFVAFFGILYAGAIPVPLYPPMRLSQVEDHLRRQTTILQNAGARVLIAVPEALRVGNLLRAMAGDLDHVVSVADIESTVSAALPHVDDPAAVALIQYTSGSTGDPKGVVLSHANLLANIRAMGTVIGANSSDIFVSWLPLYHDMGLIGAWLGCLHYAARLYVMSPLSFLIRPQSWLWAMHRFRATFSASPNFGFELCLTKIADQELEGLDLGSLRMVANGAEPVSVQTLRKFTERFAKYGFPANAMAPVYGLAECSVGLAFRPARRLPPVDRIDRDQLSLHGVAVPAKPEDPRPFELVGCGQPLPGHEIRIVDQAGRELGDRREGRIEFRGPSATSGYFHNETKTRELVRGDWRDTGDRGYMADGDIFITGRIKDIIIRAGRHLYPQEIEEAVAALPGVHKGGVAVFGVADRATGTERVVILLETRESDPGMRAALQARAHEIVTDVAGTPPDEIVLAPPRTVPKTSSGKIRRSAAKELYQSGHIGPIQRVLWWQLLRLTFAGIGPQLRRVARRISETSYAAWWWSVLGCSALAGCLAVLVLPSVSARWSALRCIGRGALRTMGVPLTTLGFEKIPRHAAVLVFNHSSYMDAFVLAATLPSEPAIVAKRELAQQVIAGLMLRRLAIPFVERYDVAGSLTDTATLTALAQQGRILVFFPEGTFTRRAGLSGFFLGAFKIAAELNVPVLPGIIKGTRTMLRSDQWFPRHSAISVAICDPIMPSGSDFQAVIRLRDQVRRVMLAHVGEPDLDELVKPEPTSLAS
ncbi:MULTISPECIES: AMP-binding protein [unclassified Bradyrhizobium]|uniref:AMP-binding protein n=1 Tax=unclassified Bradyrhizobium TaxID=2631580 RepID=UPI002916C83F|nr:MULTISPECIES: AMP-binding protein [unclassified Bradyrhizobium]